ncbi:g5632 [Coccomyxa elongata]
MPTTRNQNKALAAGPTSAKGNAAKLSLLGKAIQATAQPGKQQDILQRQIDKSKPASGVKRKAPTDLPPRPKKSKGATVTFADDCIALESQCLEPAPLPQLKCKVRWQDTATPGREAAPSTFDKSIAAEPKTPATADRLRSFSDSDLQRNDLEAQPPALNESWFNPKDPQKVNRVKGVLHTSYAPPGSQPLSREEQVQSLNDHLKASLLAGEGGSVYISGLPGTGKTLTVHAVVRECCRAMACAAEAAPVPLSINCMALPSPQAVFARLLDGVNAAAQLPLKPPADGADPFIQPGTGGACTGESQAGVLGALKAALGVTARDTSSEADRRQSTGTGRRSSVCGGGKRGRRMIVAVLDEMDQLISQDQSVLYELFTLPQLKECRLVLVGIANSIDLTARVLPRLQSLARKPQLVTFPSYSAPQLEALLHQRLSSLPGPVFHPQAIRLVAKKTASRSGDMRQVLDACAAAVDTVVQEATEADAAGDDGAESCATPAAQQRPLVRVGINPMFKAISQLQGGGSAAVLAVKGLPPQQQLLLCAAANLIGDASAQTPLKGTPSRRLSGLSCSTPMSAGNKRRLSFGCSDSIGTPGRINMSRRLSMASDASTGSGVALRKHDCQLGELHSAYEDLCKKVAFRALAPSEVSAAVSTLADMGLLGLGHAREERQRRVTLRMAVADIALALADARLLRSCLTYDADINS